MKVAICVLSYKRHDLTAETVLHNLANCEYLNIGLFVEDTFGIAKAYNNLLRRAIAEGYDAFAFLGNDILMPDRWLYDYVASTHCIGQTGMISYPVGETRNKLSYEMVIGCFMISLKVAQTVGAFDERFDPYGAIDLDYNKRCTAFGFKNYYLPHKQSVEIHKHDGKELYGFNKPALVNKTWGLHTSDTLGHIPLIDMQQFQGEKPTLY